MSFELLAADLQGNRIGIGGWESEMRDLVLEEYKAALILIRGGEANVTASDWGYLGSLVKKQYQYIDAFANDIAANPSRWMTGNGLLNRMLLYKESAWSAFSNLHARDMKQRGFTEERNILGVADHCDECLQETSKGWSPIGSLIPIGQRTCIVNDHCTMQYRKLNEDGSYTYG